MTTAPDTSATHERMKAPGCAWEADIAFGITPKLEVFDGAIRLGNAGDLSVRARRALAQHMVTLWMRFARGEIRTPNGSDTP